MLAIKKNLRYLMGIQNLDLWYSKQILIDLIRFSDADYKGCRIDRKRTSGTCQFLGLNLISWFSKKQNLVALSTTEAKYITVKNYGIQLFWIKQQLKDYGIDQNNFFLKYDNTSAINLTTNHIQHSRIKYIKIGHTLLEIMFKIMILYLNLFQLKIN